MKLARANGDKAHALKKRKDDLYETPIEAVAALLGAENLPPVLWEPACGRGAIVRPLRASGRQVYATDLVDYECQDQDMAGWDFLMETQAPLGAQAIVTNPPYKNATEFVRKGLDLGLTVIMLLRLGFLEGVGRSDIMDGPLARVHVFRDRLPLMHRDGWDGPRSTNTMAFAWFVFDSSHSGPAELRRISWRPQSVVSRSPRRLDFEAGLRHISES